jgi:3-hydroxyisobutyrate dehydrogenase-like beta-hydroxyacid dehydrogenase
MDIGLIGTGRMGRGIAQRLLDRGCALGVWNRTPGATAPLRERGAVVVSEPAELFGAGIVITMLADDSAIEAVWMRPGLLQRLPAATLHLNMASVSLHMGQRLSALHHDAGSPYVSAPVFGRPEAAASGELDIIAAGEASAVARCEALFGMLGRRWFNAGSEAHHANIIKIARNFLLGTIIESLGEAFALVRKSGVEAERFLDIITGTSMNAPAYRNYGRLMLEPPARPTFSLDLGLKDVELALAAGADTAVPLPLGTLLREQHLAAIAEGYGERDWAALGNYAAARAGL